MVYDYSISNAVQWESRYKKKKKKKIKKKFVHFWKVLKNYLWFFKLVFFFFNKIPIHLNFNKKKKKKKKKKEKKGLDILGMVKKMIDGFMIKENGILMQWMLDW